MIIFNKDFRIGSIGYIHYSSIKYNRAVTLNDFFNVSYMSVRDALVGWMVDSCEEQQIV